MDSGVRGAGEKGPASQLTGGAHAFGAPSAWLFLARLRPRRAWLRFTKRIDCNHEIARSTKPKIKLGTEVTTCQETGR